MKLTHLHRTAKIKALADVRPIAIDDADSIIRSFHFNLHNGPVNASAQAAHDEAAATEEPISLETLSVKTEPEPTPLVSTGTNGDAKVNGNGHAEVNGNGHAEVNGNGHATQNDEEAPAANGTHQIAS